MQTIYINRGFPGSGKSTETERIVQASKGKTVAVNRDYLRMMTGFQWWPANEELVTDIQTAAIKASVARGLNVVVDDTFLKNKWVNKMRALAQELGCDFKVNDSFLQVPLEKCIERDRNRARSVGKDVIERMYYDYWEQFDLPDNYGPQPALIFDLDGTLALCPKGSSYYSRDFTKDILNESVDWFVPVGAFSEAFIVMSGREATPVIKQQTEEWLKAHSLQPDLLLMRAEGDKRNDAVVKKELYMKYVQGKYEIVAVFDDRPRVVRMWRAELGLPVMQVAPNIEF